MHERRFTTSEPVRLHVRIPAGTIDVVSEAANEAVVTLDGPPKLVDAVTVELDGDRLVVAYRQPFLVSLLDRFDGALRVHATVPPRSSVDVGSAAAELTLEGTFATLVASTASGRVRTTGEIEGDARVKVVSGDVDVDHVGGDLTVRSVSGDVVAGRVEGSVTVKSVSGDVHLVSLHDGKATVQSVSGDIEVGVAPGTNVDVDAASTSGVLSSDVPLAGAPAAGGGPTLVVRGKTVSGDFRLVRAA